jgi:hypothetical protein
VPVAAEEFCPVPAGDGTVGAFIRGCCNKIVLRIVPLLLLWSCGAVVEIRAAAAREFVVLQQLLLFVLFFRLFVPLFWLLLASAAMPLAFVVALDGDVVAEPPDAAPFSC